MFLGAEVASDQPGVVICSFPNEMTKDRCVEHVATIENLLSERFACPMKVELRVAAEVAEPSQRASSGGSSSNTELSDEMPDMSELTDAPPDGRTGVDRIADAFPGARIVDVDEI